MSDRDSTRPLPPAASGATAPAPGPTAPDATAVAPAAPSATAPEYSNRPVAFRRADLVAGLLLVLAGAAAALSLPLRWLTGSDVTGFDLVREGLADPGGMFGSGLWQPLAIVLGGGVLLLLGLLLLVPARTHHALGYVGLIVSLVITAAVLVPLTEGGWDLDVFDLGFWFAMAVPVLGLLGSLKAMLSRPKYATQAPEV